MVYKKKQNKVVAHFLDGSLLKGSTSDFYSGRAKFVITDVDGHVHKVNTRELKALFFVKEWDGKRNYGERKGFFEDMDQGEKVLVEFFDGEVLFGHVLRHNPDGNGFFMVPGDPDSNNIKVFVVRASTKRVKIKRGRHIDRRRKKRTETVS